MLEMEEVVIFFRRLFKRFFKVLLFGDWGFLLRRFFKVLVFGDWGCILILGDCNLFCFVFISENIV